LPQTKRERAADDVRMSVTVRDSGRRWVVALAGLATAEVLATIVGVVATGLPFAVARDSFLISNATIGAAARSAAR
jgi:hypothetical protein